MLTTSSAEKSSRSTSRRRGERIGTTGLPLSLNSACAHVKNDQDGTHLLARPRGGVAPTLVHELAQARRPLRAVRSRRARGRRGRSRAWRNPEAPRLPGERSGLGARGSKAIAGLGRTTRGRAHAQGSRRRTLEHTIRFLVGGSLVMPSRASAREACAHCLSVLSDR